MARCDSIGPERPERYPAIKASEHLYAQAVHSFSYMKERLARALRLDDGAQPPSSAGQEGQAICDRGDG